MTATAPFNVKFELNDDNTLPVLANTKINRGQLCGLSGGYLRPLVAGDVPAGFAEETVDNSTGASGAKKCNVQPKARAVLNVTGVSSQAAVNTLVYASDDNTFTNVSTSNSFVGRVIRWEGGTRCVVQFDFLPGRTAV